MYILKRPRRNRKSAAIRDMVAETSLSVNDFIFPMFVMEGQGKKEEIKSDIERIRELYHSKGYIYVVISEIN